MSINNSTLLNQPVPFRIMLHKELIKTNILPCCGNCSNSVAQPNGRRPVDAFCTKWNAFPPMEVLLVGCEAWVDDDIPF